MYTYEYPRPAVTVDVVLVRQSSDGSDELLLIQRASPPFAGQWALPGGFVDMEEDLPVAACRELREETGISIQNPKQIGAFGEPKRDPRGRVISIAFLARITDASVTPRAGDDAAKADWFPIDRLPPLAFDHHLIIRRAMEQDQNPQSS